jgi:hypothetical protein
MVMASGGVKTHTQVTWYSFAGCSCQPGRSVPAPPPHVLRWFYVKSLRMRRNIPPIVLQSSSHQPQMLGNIFNEVIRLLQSSVFLL